MNQETRKIYHHERTLGWDARRAYQNAKIRQQWETMEADGRVRLETREDLDPYDASFVDTWGDLPEAKRERIKKEIYERANTEGVWGIVGEFHNGEDWEQADSIWGFIGDDWKDSGYDIDVMSETIAAAQNVEVCECCGRPKLK